MTATIFSPEQLNAIVKQTLPQVPDNHTNAIVGTVDQHGVQAVAVFKLGAYDRWMATGAIRHNWDGENDIGGSLIYSW